MNFNISIKLIWGIKRIEGDQIAATIVMDDTIDSQIVKSFTQNFDGDWSPNLERSLQIQSIA